MTCGIIAAVSPKGVIGVGGRLPWHYSADLRRFKRLTMGATLIMGRRTWESLPRKPLPGRRNLVITRSKMEGVECFRDIPSALATCKGDVWFIGGARLFREALPYADVIDMTFVPDDIESSDAVYFPELDPAEWRAGPLRPHEDDPRLKRRIYQRITPA
ncbi:MAG: dihydrofolate reductase [Acidobacteriota bacterium]